MSNSRHVSDATYLLAALGIGTAAMAVYSGLSGTRHTSVPARITPQQRLEAKKKKGATKNDSNPNAVLKCINDKYIQMKEDEEKKARNVVNEVSIKKYTFQK